MDKDIIESTGFVPDCLFPTDNDLEVPTLRLDRQATAHLIGQSIGNLIGRQVEDFTAKELSK